MLFKLAKAALFATVITAGGFSEFPVLAQRTAQIQFEPGADGATLSGTIVGAEYFDYKLRARAGQTMSVALTIDGTNGDGSAFFNILPPGSSGEAIFNGSMSPERYGEVTLPRDGDYTVRVYLMGNDRDAGKTVGYSVSVSIRSSGISNGGGVPNSSERAGQGNFDANGRIPCAQYLVQPKEHCSFEVAHH